MKVIIFDFDGTIADSFDLVLSISNRLATEFGYPPVDPANADRLKDLSASDILRQSKVSVFRLPFLLRRLRLELNREISTLQPIPGIQIALQQLKQQGHHLGIVTSNSSENVIAFLDVHGMADWFDFVVSGFTIFGKGKVIQRVILQQQIDPATVVYVGDETRDIEAARKIQIRAIAVSWGYNSSQALAAHQPDFLIHLPQELVVAVAGLR